MLASLPGLKTAEWPTWEIYVASTYDAARYYTSSGRHVSWWRWSYQANVLYYVNKARRIPSRLFIEMSALRNMSEDVTTHSLLKCKHSWEVMENALRWYSVYFMENFISFYIFSYTCVWIVHRWVPSLAAMNKRTLGSKCCLLKARDCSCAMHNALLPSRFYLKTNAPDSSAKKYLHFICLPFLCKTEKYTGIDSLPSMQNQSKQLTQVQSAVSITRNCRPFRKTKSIAFHLRSLTCRLNCDLVKEVPPSSNAGNAMT